MHQELFWKFLLSSIDMAGHAKNLDENVNQFANSLIPRGHRAMNPSVGYANSRDC